jgi:DNA-binding NarL/FixJ family response regulator
MISFMLVEDHPILAQAVETLLMTRSRVERFVAFRTAEEAIERLPELAVDIALVDISLPGMSGLDLIALIARERPGVRCIALSGHREATYVRRALAAGARGYINKEQATSLPQAIERVLAGEIYLSEDLAALPELRERSGPGRAGAPGGNQDSSSAPLG